MSEFSEKNGNRTESIGHVVYDFNKPLLSCCTQSIKMAREKEVYDEVSMPRTKWDSIFCPSVPVQEVGI